MNFLSKYGVARHIYIPIVKRAVVDFAVSADWTPVAGDVKISKDGGAAANVTNLPVAIVMGNGAVWDFSMTATEMQASQVVVTVVDAATKAVEDDGFVIETFGDGQGQVDLREIADAHLKRDLSVLASEPAFCALNAHRSVRNNWAITGGVRSVKKEDGSTEAFNHTITTTPGANPVTAES
jgi:hypothetical protein